MMQRLLVSLVLLGTGACATGGGGSSLYRKEIGQASGPDAVSLAEQVIHRYGFQIDTQEEEPEIRILTHWRHRLPFEDEAAVGVTSAESRILVVARARTHTELGAYYNVMFTMENRLGIASDPAWNSTLNTPLFRAWADEIAEDYKRLVANIGVRRYR